MSPSTIRVLCVDDHAEIRRLFSLVMRGYPDLEDNELDLFSIGVGLRAAVN